MKKKIFLLIPVICTILLVGCSKGEESLLNKNETENIRSLESEYVENTTEELISEESSDKELSTQESSVENSSIMVDSIKNESKNKNLENYNSLPIETKVKLVATIVDNRAIPVKIPDFDGTMFYDYYSVFQDELYINVHSGAGVGHPIYQFKKLMKKQLPQ